MLLAVATVNDYLGSAKAWHDRHCQGMIDGMFVEDEPLCRRTLAAAWETWHATKR